MPQREIREPRKENIGRDVFLTGLNRSANENRFSLRVSLGLLAKTFRLMSSLTSPRALQNAASIAEQLLIRRIQSSFSQAGETRTSGAFVSRLAQNAIKASSCGKTPEKCTLRRNAWQKKYRNARFSRESVLREKKGVQLNWENSKTEGAQPSV